MDRTDAVLVLRAVVIAVAASALALWTAGTLGLAWRLLRVAAG